MKRPIYNKAQSGSNAAIMMIIIIVLILLYILFLPPEDREGLLSGTDIPGSIKEGPVDPTTGKSVSSFVLSERIGKIYELEDGEKIIPLQTFTINTDTAGEVIQKKSTVYVKNSVFDDITERMDFEIDSKNTQNLILSFNVKEGEGTLIVNLNGNLVFRDEISKGNSPPIYLDENYLDEYNTLTFEVTGPGIAFWTYNHYTLSDLKVTADITDTTQSASTQTFNINSRDLVNLQSSRIKYLPDCKESDLRGYKISVNGKDLFSGIPDCRVFNFVTLGNSQLNVGTNTLTFELGRGQALIDQPEVQLRYEDPEYPTYYFDLDEKYFTKESESEQCGEIDGYCPAGCESDLDKDCCLQRSDNYWCDVDTDNFNDRCVSFVADCDRCLSGYEDRRGDAPSKCIEEYATKGGYCGDDNDGVCPAGCSKYYDKDCCFDESEENFWCEDVPITGLQSVCEAEIHEAECDDCPSGYENGDGDAPSCPTSDTRKDYDEELLSSYDVKIEFTFPNNDRKEFEVWINGRKFGVNTYENNYDRLIDEYVKSGTNSIQIEPEMDITITEMRIKLLR